MFNIFVLEKLPTKIISISSYCRSVGIGEYKTLYELEQFKTFIGEKFYDLETKFGELSHEMNGLSLENDNCK